MPTFLPIQGDRTPINIVQIHTEDVGGGASNAAYRLYTGIKSLNPTIHILVKYKNSDNPDVIPVLPDNDKLDLEIKLSSEFVHQHYVNKNRSGLSNTLFSYPLIGYNFGHSNVIKNADVVNLHWISFFCSLSGLSKIIDMRKPIVWTLHDQWVLTGGCHYTSGCNQYLDKCIRCLQLVNDERQLPSHFYKRKRELLKRMNPVIVTPSHWLADTLKKDIFFQNMRVEVIPNSIDTALYTNIPKKTARDRLNIPLDGFYLLFCINNAAEKRKGIHFLISSLQYCMDDPAFFHKVTAGEIRVMCFGDPRGWTNTTGIPLISLGRIKSESELCTVYSAANLFLVPSTDDNLPNIVMEAMSCGTPTIAFKIGGIPEMIRHGLNGCIVEQTTARAYATMILELCNNPDHCKQMSEHCRTIAIQNYSLDVQANRYLDLYGELVHATGTNNNESPGAMIHESYEILPVANDTYADETILKTLSAHKDRILQKTDHRIRITDQHFRYQKFGRLAQLLTSIRPGNNLMHRIHNITKQLIHKGRE
ncbi:MAG: putative glycosyl transferase [Methanoregulaceae archaeon PtaB.Bin009]|nr:MAG: putative glycosyl transferase [Methanoregulaceae archaeon PtaB.Bin009]OPY42329.1 MAG: putative glycosyl transferase [Methanoregulaceae archaeon PtaU1.Bin066]